MPLIDLKTNLKSLKYGNDRPGGGNSGQPYITNDINNPKNRLGFDDGLIRGGAVGALKASINDTARIGKFLKDFPKGPLFIVKQVGLQFSNPKLEVKKVNTGIGFIDRIADFAQDKFGLGPTRLYNLGINTLAQVPVNAFGIHFNRHGLLPVQDDSTKYLAVVQENNAEGTNGENNRLVGYKTKFSLGDRNDNKALSLPRTGILGALLNALPFKFAPKDLTIDNYLGGPKSIYGIGNTLIRRYDNTEDAIKINTAKDKKIGGQAHNSTNNDITSLNPKVAISTEGPSIAVYNSLDKVSLPQSPSLQEYKDIVQLLQKGIAIHHSGIMPVLREMVELLFEKGFIKLLFATETVGIGLDLPVKSVIFTGINKFSGSGMRQLYPHEYTQMAGRAGRRGKDTVGHVFHCNNLFEMPLNTDYKNMLTGAPQTLTSKFKISFNLILNILGQAELFVGQSLMATDIKKDIQYYEQEQEELEIQFIIKKEILGTCKTPTFKMADYNHIVSLLPSTVNSAKKKLRSDMSKIEAEYKTLEADLKKFSAFNEIVDKLEKNSRRKKNTASYFTYHIDKIQHILSSNGFINIDHKVSDKGRIASQLQEIHPLAMADIYTLTNGFAEFSAVDIVALFSCFSSVSVNDDSKTYKPKTSNDNLNHITLQLSDLLESYYSLELKAEVETGSSYDVHYDLMTHSISWCNATNEAECKAVIYNVKVEKNIFLGEFVKAILKINNIGKEFEKVCELMNNMALLEKLKEIPKLTLKYVVASQSLYI